MSPSSIPRASNQKRLRTSITHVLTNFFRWSLWLIPAPVLLQIIVSCDPSKHVSAIVYLIVWLLVCCVFLWLPKLAEQHGWVNSDTAVGFYYKGGQLLVLFGCASAVVVLHSSATFLPSEFKEVAKLGLLGFAALTGGALCSDAILGADIEARRTRITITDSALATVSFLCVAALEVIILNGWRVPDLPMLGAPVIALAVSIAPPVLGAFIVSLEGTGFLAKRKAGLLFFAGMIAIAISVDSVFFVESGLKSAGWDEASYDFLKEMLPAYGAAIGACFIARSIEITKPTFARDAWAKKVSAMAFNGTVTSVEIKQGCVIVKTHYVDPSDTELDGQITLIIHDEVLKELEHHGAIKRNFIGSEAIIWLKKNFEKDQGRRKANFSCTYKLDKEFLKSNKPRPVRLRAHRAD